MGRIGDAVRGLRVIGGYLAGMPAVNRRILAAGTADEARAMVREHARRALRAGGIEVVLSGQEHVPERACVITYNETAVPDLLVLNSVMWGPFADLGATAPMWAWMPWMRAAGPVAGVAILPRSRPEVDRLLDDYARAASEGARVMWGGEGRLSGKDMVTRFKTGGARIAIRGRVPLVPMAMRGGHQIQPLGSLRMRPGTVRVAWGPPIDTAGLEEDDARDLADRAQAAVAELHAELGAEPRGS